MSALTTPEAIETYRLCTLRTALKLEIKGLKFRSKSAYSILKTQYGYKGTRQSVLEQVVSEIEYRKSHWHGLGF